MKFMNWIEEKIGRQITGAPVYVGSKGGRRIYAVTFTDGTEEDYYIDYDRKTVEAY